MMQINAVLGLIALVLYAMATTVQVRLLLAGFARVQPRILVLGGGAWMLHMAGLMSVLFIGGASTLRLTEMLSLIFALVTVLLLIMSLYRPVVNSLIFIFPLSAISLLTLINPPINELTEAYTTRQWLHIGLSVAAFSVLFAATLQALLLAVGEYFMRHKRHLQTMAGLPALVTMETLLFQLILAGFVLLSVLLLTSVMFLPGPWTQLIFEKMLLAVLAWVVFFGLLLGRHFYGWRGRVAIRGTLLGMLILFLSYFGTRLWMVTSVN